MNMYKVRSLWILLLTIVTSVSVESLNEPCQRHELKGHCKLLISCKFVLDLLKKYNGTQIETTLSCGRLNIMPLVCCPNTTVIAPEADESAIHFPQDDFTTPPPLRSTPIALTTTPKRHISPPAQSTPTLPSRNVCGKQTIENRIVGGEIASLYDFPWIVRIRLIGISTTEICSGTLITNQHVITAAHCVSNDPEKLVSVRLGEWDSTNEADCSEEICSDPPEDRNVTKVIVHPLYKNDRDHDIAILVLDEPVNFTDFIKPVCLPTTEYVASQDYTNDNTYMTAGWGYTEYGTVSTKKRKLSIKAASYSLCEAIFNLKHNPGDPFAICAGGVKNKDTCTGDSGGPLMGQVAEEHEVNWYLFGITSRGSVYCGRAGIPGIYTRVSKYMSWIESNLSG